MRGGAAWLLLSEEALGLVLVVAAFALMFGLMRGRAFLGLVALIVLLPTMTLLVEEILGQLPPWVVLVVVVVVGLAILRGLASLVLGTRAAETMVGSLAADVVRLAVMLMILPVRMLARVARAGLNGFSRDH
jgi:hypothetical protein